MGQQQYNNHDVFVSGFLLWFLMPHDDSYIKLTESAVIYNILQSLSSSSVQNSEGKLLHFAAWI